MKLGNANESLTKYTCCIQSKRKYNIHSYNNFIQHHDLDLRVVTWIQDCVKMSQWNNNFSLNMELGAAVVEWLSSWLAEQEVRSSIPGLATWISEIGYLLLPGQDMAEIPLKQHWSSIQPTKQTTKYGVAQRKLNRVKNMAPASIKLILHVQWFWPQSCDPSSHIYVMSYKFKVSVQTVELGVQARAVNVYC